MIFAETMPHDNDSRSRLEKAWARSCRPGQDGAGAGRLVQRRVGAHADDDEGASPGRPWGMRHPHRACGGSGAAREHERGSLESMAEGSHFQMRKCAEREKSVQTSRVPVLACSAHRAPHSDVVTKGYRLRARSWCFTAVSPPLETQVGWSS